VSLKEYLIGQNVDMLEMGNISGLNGLLIGVASQTGISGICLLGEIPYYTVNLENPRAAWSVLHLLQTLLSLRIDFHSLEDDIKKFDREISRIGKKTQETMETFIHSDEDSMEFGGLVEDEEEEEEEEEESKPLSDTARLRIEELFRQVKQDPLRAPRLKEELDKWGVYHIYEDRFLDLFRRGEAG